MEEMEVACGSLQLYWPDQLAEWILKMLITGRWVVYSLLWFLCFVCRSSVYSTGIFIT